ncbi:ABC transporter ATP-binding protein [Aliiroseovarius crassostreae]|uniref:ABC transporter ATP-binding protein n=1 Tax=Aliiroseovarius crassostreae TaxID=154981 RepID=UPI003C797B18
MEEIRAQDALLTLDGLTKAYPGVIANNNVSFSILPGEVHALLGENGAGKSTLVKMIYGLVKPDQGEMRLKGELFEPYNPAAARAAGVAMVFQHFSLFDALSVAENIALGMDNPPKPRALTSQIRQVSEAYGLPLDPNRVVGELSAGERQRVEIIRCLLQNPKLLIMDEPTSVLTPQEVEVLFETLRKLTAEGTAILYISHKLEEIRALCEHATILRHGEVVDTCDPREKSARELAEMMVGTSLHVPEREPAEPGDVVLEMDHVSLHTHTAFGIDLKDVSLTVRAGEVVGIGGVAGNGQDEFLSALSGEAWLSHGEVRLNGTCIAKLRPNERRALAVLSAPEERLGHSAAPDMSLTENALLTAAVRQRLTKRGFLRWGKTESFAKDVIKEFDVRTPGPDNAARSLSGGNLQKFVIGREVLQKPEVLVVNQPTWGVDASAAAAIRQSLLDLAAEGAAVIVISQDLDELLEISDRFTALYDGTLATPVPTKGLTVDTIGLMMGGGDDSGEKETAA